MQLHAAWGKIGIGVSMCLSVAACDGAASANADQNNDMQVQTESNAPPANPCLDSAVLSALKQDIKDQALILANIRHASVINTERLQQSEISFDQISTPTSIGNGDVICEATATVRYNANEEYAYGSMGSGYMQIMRAYPSIRGDFDAQMTVNEVKEMGITEYDVDDFTNVVDNQFSYRISYDLMTTYSEDGQPQQSYQAALAKPAGLLAVIATLESMAENHQKTLAARESVSASS